MYKTFEDYIVAVHRRCVEDNYGFTLFQIAQHKDYFMDCWKNDLSVYKSLEFFGFELNGR